MKTLPLLAIATAALLPLAACNSHKAADQAAANDTAAANMAAPVELPPAIKADKTFRCKDNSLAAVTFFQGDKQAVIKAPSTATPVVLKAPTAGEPYVADGGWTMTGDEKSVTITAPGKPAVVCHT